MKTNKLNNFASGVTKANQEIERIVKRYGKNPKILSQKINEKHEQYDEKMYKTQSIYSTTRTSTSLRKYHYYRGNANAYGYFLHTGKKMII